MNIIKVIGLFFCAALFFIVGCKQESYFDKALAYQNDAEYDRAVEFYYKAIEQGDRVAESEKNIGDICLGDRNYDEAFGHYKRSIETDPNIALRTVMKYISYNDAHVRELVGNIFSEINNEQANEQINEELAKILNSGDQYKILDALAVVSKMGEKG
nr:hypothetical protein [Endomicrobiaceae bacterium]